MSGVKPSTLNLAAPLAESTPRSSQPPGPYDIKALAAPLHSRHNIEFGIAPDKRSFVIPEHVLPGRSLDGTVDVPRDPVAPTI